MCRLQSSSNITILNILTSLISEVSVIGVVLGGLHYYCVYVIVVLCHVPETLVTYIGMGVRFYDLC